MGFLKKLFGSSDGKETGGAAKQPACDEPPKPMVPSNRVDELVEAVKNATCMRAFALRYEDAAPKLAASKIGGLPYWPRDVAAPEPVRDGLVESDCFALLAQLDLADLGGDPRLPDHGLLQFFITTDDLSGLEFDVPMDAQRHFRVVWHESIDESVTRQDVAERGFRVAGEYDNFPVGGEYALSVEPTTCWMTPADERFDAAFRSACAGLFGSEYDDASRSWMDYLDDEGCDALNDALNVGNSSQNLVLGYPIFTQWDPRSAENIGYFDTLLLQLDSDFGHPSKIMWGDSGVGNFFINGDALAKGDFGRVLYNWDCY